MEFEVARQGRILNHGGKVESETRGWREETGETASQRSKEEAHDYRYFPEPDLPPIAVSREWVAKLRAQLPELPDARRERLVSQYGLTPYEANLLTESRAKADYYEQTLNLVSGEDLHARAKLVANWALGDVARLINDSGLDFGDSDVKLRPEGLAALMRLLQDGGVTNAAAKEVLRAAFATGAEPETIVEERGLGAIETGDVVIEAVRKVIAEQQKAVADYKAGKETALKALLGGVMKETRGRAKPQDVERLLKEELNRSG
jgi:aspartyl-tRNA(Asn)/glutamyl-tRNA(Gln) amidotransferase subunit B